MTLILSNEIPGIDFGLAPVAITIFLEKISVLVLSSDKIEIVLLSIMDACPDIISILFFFH